MMREEFYHSQYGDPDHHITRCHVDYDEGVEYIEADGDEIKPPETDAAHESFLWFEMTTSFGENDALYVDDG